MTKTKREMSELPTTVRMNQPRKIKNMRKQLYPFFIAKLKPHTVLRVYKEYRGDGFKYSVRDWVQGMTGTSSWCYGRFMTIVDAIKEFPNAVNMAKGLK